MQQKNLLVFFALTFLLFIGWSALVNYYWPPPKRKPPRPIEQRILLPDARLWAGLPGLVRPPAAAGLGAASQLATEVALAEWAAGDRRHWVRVEPVPVPKPRPKEPPIAQEVLPPIEMGAATYKLHVVLTPRGGAVQSVILNQFEQATRFGRPAQPPENLHLVPEDAGDPSNALYHYADPKASHPLDALGKQAWKPIVKKGKTFQIKNTDTDEEEYEVVFEKDVPGMDVRITKTYTLRKGDYHLGLALTFESTRAGAEPLSFRYQLAGAHGLPIEGDWYTYTYRNALIGNWDEAKGNILRDLQESRAIGFQAGGKEVNRKENEAISYAGVITQYFASVVVLDNQQAEGVKPNFLAWARPTVEGKPHPEQPFLDDITVRLVSEPIELKPGKPVVHKYLLYNGPVKVSLLGQLGGDKAVAPALVERYEKKLHLNTLTDYHSPNPFGTFANTIGWSQLLIHCTNLMHRLLQILHVIVPNYGICIILLTVLVRGAMFPLSRRQALASVRMQEKMQELAPEVKKLEEKHKNDAMALQQAKNELYLKKGINPLAMMGSCWMVFLQMPIFLGLYYSLQESIHFRLAPFLWIKNLAAPDMLIEWGEKIPWISQPKDMGGFLYLGPFFNILPIIAVGLMIVQQKMMTPPPADEQQALQQSMMKWMMVFFGLMFYKIAAGLCIYFIASSLWGVAERKLLPKRQTIPDGAAPPPVKRGGTGAPTRTRSRKMEANGAGLTQKLRDWWDELLKQARKK